MSTGCLECDEIQKNEVFPSVGMCVGCKIKWNISQIRFHKSQLTELRKEAKQLKQKLEKQNELPSSKTG